MEQPNRFQRAMRGILKGLFGVNWGIPGAGTWEYAQNWEKALPVGNATDLQEPYRQHSTIAVAISIIAEDASSIEWQLFPVGADEPLEEHPLFDLLAAPNPFMNGLQLWIGTYVVRNLFGEAFWYFPDASLTRPGGLDAMKKANQGGLLLLDPRRVINKNTTEGVEWKLRVGDGTEQPLDADALTQFKRFNPYNQVRGLSKVESVIADLSGDFNAANWNARFFGDQNGIPSGLIKPALGSVVSTDKDQRQELLRTWNQRHTGTKRSVGILPAGWDWQDLGVNQRDMDYRSLREYSREQVLAAFGVPPFFAGVLDKANYANAREQKEVYWLGTITRFVKAIQAALNSDFLPKIGLDGYELRPNWGQVKSLTENLGEKVEIAGSLFAMGFPKRQIIERLELGFDPDEFEDADVGYLPFNLAPVDMLNTPPAPPPAPILPPAGDEETEEDAEKSLQAAPADEARRALVWRNIATRTRDLENQFNRTIRKHFQDIRAEVLENLQGIKGWRLANGGVQVTREAESPDDLILFDVDLAKKKLQKVTKPLHKAALVRGGEALIAETGFGIVFNLQDPVVTATLLELTMKITRIDDTVERLLREELFEGVLAHETLDELTERVNHSIGVSLSRSMTIARTETGFAFNGGRYAGMKQAGITRQEWLSSRDTDVRETHWLDGERVALGERFSNGLAYPQDPAGPPEEIINCRCVAVPVVTEE